MTGGAARRLLGLLRVIAVLPAPLRAALRRSPLYRLYQRALTQVGARAGDGVYRILGGPLAGLGIDTDPATVRAYILGDYEPAIAAALTRLCRPGMVVADVGAHHGYFSLLMAQRVGLGGACVSFEASPANAGRIARSAVHNGLAHLRVESAAVADGEGELRFAMLDTAQLMGRLESLIPAEDQAKFSRHQVVPAVTLDTYWARRGLPGPHVVKIDVEGAELAVLRGSGRILTEERPSLVIEVHDFAPAEDSAVPLMRLLEDAGYALSSIEDGCALDPSVPFAGHLLAVPLPAAVPPPDA